MGVSLLSREWMSCSCAHASYHDGHFMSCKIFRSVLTVVTITCHSGPWDDAKVTSQRCADTYRRDSCLRLWKGGNGGQAVAEEGGLSWENARLREAMGKNEGRLTAPNSAVSLLMFPVDRPFTPPSLRQ